MRIPITINDREDPWVRRRRDPLRGRPVASNEYEYDSEYDSPTVATVRGPADPTGRNRPRLAVGDEKAREDRTARSLSGGEGPAAPAQRTPAYDEKAAGREEAREDWKGRYLRLRADFENYRRNAEAEREKLSGIGKEKILEDVFPLVEHMERAIRAARDAGDRTGILEGIEMVYQELLRTLDKHGVRRIQTVGEPFDPEIHEAVAVAPHPQYPEDTVIEEVRAGFVRDGRLLRPASVVVAR